MGQKSSSPWQACSGLFSFVLCCLSRTCCICTFQLAVRTDLSLKICCFKEKYLLQKGTIDQVDGIEIPILHAFVFCARLSLKKIE